MSQTILRYCTALLLLGLGLLSVGPAQARITCTNFSISNVAFGNVDPQSSQTDVTATVSYTCRNSSLVLTPRRSATICLSIGEPGGDSINPRQMEDTSNNTLAFQLYQDSGRSIIWGSQFFNEEPLMRNVTLQGGLLTGGDPVNYTDTIYGRVLAGQSTAIPASYTNNYASVDTAITINQQLGNTPPGECSEDQRASLGSFTVSANVVKKCTVTASSLDFSTNPGLLNNTVDSSTTLSVQCSKTTPYHVGLGAGQNSSGNINARQMAQGASRVGYQLYRDAARTQVWGDTVGTDTVTGTGDGSTQSLTVYGRVPPQTTPPAGTYSDTVVVTVTY